MNSSILQENLLKNSKIKSNNKNKDYWHLIKQIRKRLSEDKML